MQTNTSSEGGPVDVHRIRDRHHRSRSAEASRDRKRSQGGESRVPPLLGDEHPGVAQRLGGGGAGGEDAALALPPLRGREAGVLPPERLVPPAVADLGRDRSPPGSQAALHLRCSRAAGSAGAGAAPAPLVGRLAECDRGAGRARQHLASAGPADAKRRLPEPQYAGALACRPAVAAAGRHPRQDR